MKKYILAAVLGGAMMLTVPAFATGGSYIFNTTGCSGTTGPTACGTNLSAYGPISSTGSLTGVTATAVGVYYSVGSATAFTNAALTAGDLGAYAGAGLGACETTGADCGSPAHQIDNGHNGFTTDDYEFVLIKFSAAIDLSSIQLGNFGSGGSDPFNITYYTSTSAASSLALAGTTLGVGNSFSTAQSQSSQSGSCIVGSTTCTDNMTGAIHGVTYLLIGASIADNGTDYFKIENITGTTNSGSSSATPEPATFGLIGLALAGLGIYGRKRKSGKN